MSAKQSIKCAYCANDASEMRSGEHICSAWIGKLFGPQEYNWTRSSLRTGKVRRWKKKAADEKIRDVVCSDCNSGWMSELENEAKPALTNIIRDGFPQCLLPRGIMLLAAFAFNKAVVANHSNLNREPFFTLAARERFRSRLQVPMGVQIWVGKFNGIYANSGIFSSHYLAPQPGANPGGDFELYVFNFAAGHLVLQVLAVKWTKLLHRGLPLPFLTSDPVWDAVAIDFWPPDGTPVVWPPTHYLDANSIKQFADRWNAPLERRIV